MSHIPTPAELGEPDVKVAGFSLWVRGRQVPEAHDYYDGNWLRVNALCAAPGASVWVQGPIVMVSDIARFASECEAMLQGASTSAVLESLEPELRVSLESADDLGHIRAEVEITADHLAQSHNIEFAIDQRYLPSIIKQASAVVREDPIRGQKSREGVTNPVRPTRCPTRRDHLSAMST